MFHEWSHSLCPLWLADRWPLCDLSSILLYLASNAICTLNLFPKSVSHNRLIVHIAPFYRVIKQLALFINLMSCKAKLCLSLEKYPSSSRLQTAFFPKLHYWRVVKTIFPTVTELFGWSALTLALLKWTSLLLFFWKHECDETH